MKSVLRCTAFFLFFTYPLALFAQITCEQYRAEYIKWVQDGSCSADAGCQEGSYWRSCISYSGVSVTSAENNSEKISCVGTQVYDTWDDDPAPPDVPPTHDVSHWVVEYYIGRCNTQPPPPSNPPSGPSSSSGPPGSCPIKGSIVHLEDRSLSESVPIVGAPFSLFYHSSFQEGRTANFKIKIDISGDEPRDYIQSFVVENRRNGVLVDTVTYPTSSANQNYSYIWNGMDASNTTKVPSAKFSVAINETSPVGTFPVLHEITLAHFSAKGIGLGGWLPSILKRYDPLAMRMYSAEGGFTEVEAKPIDLTYLYVPSSSGNEVYIFDATGRHIQTRTGLTGATIFSFNYDVNGYLISISQPFGRTTFFNRNLSGKIVSITSPKGQITTIGLDTNDYISSIKNPNNETYNFTYYGIGGLLYTFQKPRGELSSFYYDTEGYIVKDEHSGGYFFDLVKGINFGVGSDVTVTSSMGRTVNVQTTVGSESINRNIFSSSGLNTSSSYTKQGSEYNRYDVMPGYSRMALSSDDKRFGKGVRFVQNETLSINGAGSRQNTSTQDITLNDTNDPFSVSSWLFESQLSGTNTKVSTSYDPITKTFTSTTYLNRTTEVKIDSYERVTSWKKGSLNAVLFNYSSENLASISQGSRTTTLDYNTTSGFLESITSPLNQATTFVYNNAGRVTSKILPDSRVIGFGYDANGNVTSVTPPGKPAHVFGINAHEVVGSYEPPTLSGVSVVNTTYQYNLDKQLTQITRPDGATIDFNYGLTTGVLESFVTPDGTYTQTMDTTNGLPSTIYQPDNSWTSISYAGTSMIGSTNYDSSSSMIGSYAPTFSSVALVESDTVTNSIGTTSTISYQYNDDEDLKKAGDVTLTYNTPNGQLTGTSMGSGTSAITDAYTYNNYGEVTDYVAKRGTTTIYSLTLARDASGRINGKTQTMNGTTDAYDYTFDVTGRLTETKKNTATVATYNYDSNSNRNGGTIGAQPTSATYDDQDRLLTYNTLSFTYNANGDLASKTNNTLSQTTQYTYDVFGNLKQVQLPSGTVITYEVDALNRRIGKRVNGVLQRRWVYMDQYRIAAELNASGAITKRFVYGSKSNIPDYMIMGSTKYRIISDHLGSPRLVVKMSDGSIAQRMDHDEFGRVTVNTSADFTPFGFAGGLYDQQTGLVRFGARDYDPETGRWTSKDPILFKGGDVNIFGYVQNDPVNFVDPIGLWSIQASIFTGAGGSITIGADNSSGRPFITLRFGYGIGVGASYDEKGSSPVPQCPQNGPNASIGLYGDASVTNGPHEVGVSGGGGVSSKRSAPYYLYSSPTNTLGTSMGVGGGASVGVELSFF
ncbi:RHS repeat domain-containing protein [Bdellovibrio sp. BCCA]|uniref:RHS repeat domain-containing protein n=1 Tax=Bdellovibrio sp. BCCA TaxID=3136281 RepID=UPI0030F11797